MFNTRFLSTPTVMPKPCSKQRRKIKRARQQQPSTTPHAVAPTAGLATLSRDEAGVISRELCTSLEPRCAVAFSSASRMLWALRPLEILRELRVQYNIAAALAAKTGMTCDQLRQAQLAIWTTTDNALTMADMRTLGNVSSLLVELKDCHILYPSRGVEQLAERLKKGALPGLSCFRLGLASDQLQPMGDVGSAALAAALAQKGAMPQLRELCELPHHESIPQPLTRTTVADPIGSPRALCVRSGRQWHRRCWTLGPRTVRAEAAFVPGAFPKDEPNRRPGHPQPRGSTGPNRGPPSAQAALAQRNPHHNEWVQQHPLARDQEWQDAVTSADIDETGAPCRDCRGEKGGGRIANICNWATEAAGSRDVARRRRMRLGGASGRG